MSKGKGVKKSSSIRMYEDDRQAVNEVYGSLTEFIDQAIKKDRKISQAVKRIKKEREQKANDSEIKVDSVGECPIT